MYSFFAICSLGRLPRFEIRSETGCHQVDCILYTSLLRVLHYLSVLLPFCTCRFVGNQYAECKKQQRQQQYSDTLCIRVYMSIILSQYLVCACDYCLTQSMGQPGKVTTPARGQLN